jgi:hypothetical protein
LGACATTGQHQWQAEVSPGTPECRTRLRCSDRRIARLPCWGGDCTATASCLLGWQLHCHPTVLQLSATGLKMMPLRNRNTDEGYGKKEERGLPPSDGGFGTCFAKQRSQEMSAQSSGHRFNELLAFKFTLPAADSASTARRAIRRRRHLPSGTRGWEQATAKRHRLAHCQVLGGDGICDSRSATP